MDRTKRAERIIAALAIVAIAGSVAFGVVERLEDPLSTSVVAAEDPYTHMILVRGHLRDGDLDAVFPGATLYPPGMHALIATAWVYTGLDLYDIFRVGPVVFGALGIIGVAVLVTRFAGPMAGAVAALATALAPELIFRTTMMAPTAVDLAILPFVLAGSLQTLRGSRGWAFVSAAFMAFWAVAHPWMLAIMAPLLLGWILVAIVAVWWMGKGARIDPIGAAITLALAGASLIAAVTICWDECGLGFQDLVFARMQAALDRISMGIGLVCLAVVALLVPMRARLQRFQARVTKTPMPVWVRIITSASLAGLLVAGTLPAMSQGMPEHVDLPRMYGWGVLGLAALAIVLAPFIRHPAVLPVAALAVVTYPFVIYNPLDSPYWPHRTAAYLGVALVALTGIAADAVVRALRAVADGISRRAAHRARNGTQSAMRHSRVWSLGAIATIIGGTAMIGTVYAATPVEYDHGWYRLYPDCEFNTLRGIAENAEPGTVIVAGSWQAKLVMGAFAHDGMDVWYSYEMLTQEDRRERTLRGLQVDGHDMIIVTDRYLRTDHERIDLSFLDDEPWEPMGAWCGEGLDSARMKAYTVRAVDA